MTSSSAWLSSSRMGLAEDSRKWSLVGITSTTGSWGVGRLSRPVESTVLMMKAPLSGWAISWLSTMTEDGFRTEEVKPCDSKLDGADESYSSLVSLADPRLSRTFRVVAAGAGATLEVTGEGTPSIELGLGALSKSAPSPSPTNFCSFSSVQVKASEGCSSSSKARTRSIWSAIWSAVSSTGLWGFSEGSKEQTRS